MARVEFCFMCRDALIDQRSNLLSPIGIIEKIQVVQKVDQDNKLPENQWIVDTSANTVTLKIVTMFTRSEINSPEFIKARICIESDEGEAYETPTELDIDIRENINVRSLITTNQIPFHSNGGRHYFVVKQRIQDDDWIEIFRSSFIVEIRTTELLQPSEQRTDAGEE